MRSTTLPCALLGLFALVGLVGCGREAAPEKHATAPVAPTAPSALPAAPNAPSFVGTLEVQGVTLTMQGTHQLVDAGKVVCLLGSRTLDLAPYVGKKVRVTGPTSPTVEGHQTIVDVVRVDVLP